MPLLELRPSVPAHQVCRHLHAMPVPVHLGEGEMDDGLLTLNPMTVPPQDDALVAACIREAVLACAAADPPRPAGRAS